MGLNDLNRRKQDVNKIYIENLYRSVSYGFKSRGSYRFMLFTFSPFVSHGGTGDLKLMFNTEEDITNSVGAIIDESLLNNGTTIILDTLHGNEIKFSCNKFSDDEYRASVVILFRELVNKSPTIEPKEINPSISDSSVFNKKKIDENEIKLLHDYKEKLLHLADLEQLDKAKSDLKVVEDKIDNYLNGNSTNNSYNVKSEVPRFRANKNSIVRAILKKTESSKFEELNNLPNIEEAEELDLNDELDLNEELELDDELDLNEESIELNESPNIEEYEELNLDEEIDLDGDNVLDDDSVLDSSNVLYSSNVFISPSVKPNTSIEPSPPSTPLSDVRFDLTSINRKDGLSPSQIIDRLFKLVDKPKFDIDLKNSIVKDFLYLIHNNLVKCISNDVKEGNTKILNDRLNNFSKWLDDDLSIEFLGDENFGYYTSEIITLLSYGVPKHSLEIMHSKIILKSDSVFLHTITTNKFNKISNYALVNARLNHKLVYESFGVDLQDTHVDCDTEDSSIEDSSIEEFIEPNTEVFVDVNSDDENIVKSLVSDTEPNNYEEMENWFNSKMKPFNDKLEEMNKLLIRLLDNK